MSRATPCSTSSRPFSSRSRVQLHPKQGVAYFSTAMEVLYSGAAGGGNSHLMRAAAISWCGVRACWWAKTQAEPPYEGGRHGGRPGGAQAEDAQGPRATDRTISGV